jgi:hypothetical protein
MSSVRSRSQAPRGVDPAICSEACSAEQRVEVGVGIGESWRKTSSKRSTRRELLAESVWRRCSRTVLGRGRACGSWAR